MNEDFVIPVDYKGEELEFRAQLLNYGYSYKIQVDINGLEVLFEPDEERNFRVILDPEKLDGQNKIDTELLKVIAGVLESSVK
jgi:hypothetical protein